MAKPKPLTFGERIGLGVLSTERVEEGRSERAKRIAGLTTKQAALLTVLVGFGGEGPGALTARDCEAHLARTAPSTGVVGWSASDCTVTLHRLQARGLVRAVRVSEGNVRLRWVATELGERAYLRWLDEVSPRWRDDLAFVLRAEA